MVAAKEYQTLPFASPALWEQWLSAHHDQCAGVWIKMAKKASGIASIAHDGALDVALCYGWIDGQRKTLDDSFFLQKFTPRRPKGLWSQRNVEKIAALMATGRMRPAGLAEVAAARRDGRWEAAYASPQNMTIPADFQQALAENERARATFDSLSRSDAYAIAWRLVTAKKPETRQRRFDTLLAILERGEKPQ